MISFNLQFKAIFLIGFLALLSSCSSKKEKITVPQFETLMENIATGWSTQNTDLALGSFDINAVYMQPPNKQFYKGHIQLRSYFNALDEHHKMKFYNLWFNENRQTGAGEFTFSYGKDTADVGIAVVELKKGKIVFWREYLTKGPTDFSKFISITNKSWDWHIGNYPAPKDSLNLKD